MSEFVCENPFCQSTKFSGKKLHLGLTGSVACYKAIELMRAWLKLEIEISATLTRSASQFITSLLLEALGAKPVYGEMFAVTDVFAHLEPGRNVECMAIVPATANFIAKMAAGIADDMLSCQYAAYNGQTIIAPAMNPRMWAHTAAQANIAALRERGVGIIGPARGEVACGENGAGKLADGSEIFLGVLKAMSPQDMAGLKVMVTLGPTREFWDDVRFWSNPSSGKMGSALATAAWLRGAEVTAICGPGASISLPAAVHRIDVVSAQQMHAEAEKIWPDMDLGLFCAAVADFAPARPMGEAPGKIGKETAGEDLRIEFVHNPDILADMAAKRQARQKTLGFAAEIVPDAARLAQAGERKRAKKNADLLAANMVNPGGGAFGAQNAAMVVLDKNGGMEEWSTQCKADIAWELLSWLLKL